MKCAGYNCNKSVFTGVRISVRVLGAVGRVSAVGSVAPAANMPSADTRHHVTPLTRRDEREGLRRNNQISVEQLDVNQKAIEVQMASAQTKIDQAKAQLAQSQASLKEQEIEVSRITELLKTQAATPIESERIIAQRDATRAARARARRRASR